MKYILFVMAFGSSGDVSSGNALTSQQMIFNSQQMCEEAKTEILKYGFLYGKTGIGTEIGKFFVKASCFKQGA